MAQILQVAEKNGSPNVTMMAGDREILVRVVDASSRSMWYILSMDVDGVITDFVVFGSREDAVELQGGLITAANPEKHLN